MDTFDFLETLRSFRIAFMICHVTSTSVHKLQDHLRGMTTNNVGHTTSSLERGFLPLHSFMIHKYGRR